MLAAACLVVACGSTSVTEVTGPSDVRCQTSLTANPQAVTADGGTVTIGVSTTRDCAWTSTADASWIRLSETSGQGEATFTASVEANPQIVSRTGTVSVNAQRVSISQAARPCTFSLDTEAMHFGAEGGAGQFRATTLAGCTWRATTDASWVQVPATAFSGSQTVDVRVAANGGSERTAVVRVADAFFVVTQAAAGTAPPDCTAVVAPLAIEASAAASTHPIQLTVGPTCAWSAVSSVPWVTITSAAAGTGPATVTVAVAANVGAARSGVVTVAGQQVTVRQTALSCTFAISPASQNVAAGGGGGRFTVTTGSSCTWTATSNASWLAVANGAGTGTGDVSFVVQPNTATTARSAAISVGGQTFTVNQAAAACSYELSPGAVDIGSGGGHGRVTVTTSSACGWTAVAGAEWIIIANSSGAGSGDVNFNVAANTAAQTRSSTITVGGQRTTITQAGVGCSYAVDPTSASIPAAGGDGQFTVSTQAGCAWTVSGGAGWISITSPPGGSGTGTGAVTFTVEANPDPAARSATFTVGGQTFTITEAAAAPQCTYALSPSSGSYAAGTATGMFTVTTQAGCAWTATTLDPWITLADASGSGTGNVTFSIAANTTGQARTGAISVGGQIYAVMQAP